MIAGFRTSVIRPVVGLLCVGLLGAELAEAAVPRGGEANGCLAALRNELHRGQSVDLRLRTGLGVKGTLEGFDSKSNTLTLTTFDSDDSRFQSREIPLRDIETVGYRETGRAARTVAILGLLGAGAGFVVGSAYANDPDAGGGAGITLATTLLGAAAGSLLGGTLALGAGLGRGRSRTIACR